MSGLEKPCRDDGCAVGLDVDVGALKKDGHVPEQRRVSSCVALQVKTLSANPDDPW